MLWGECKGQVGPWMSCKRRWDIPHLTMQFSAWAAPPWHLVSAFHESTHWPPSVLAHLVAHEVQGEGLAGPRHHLDPSSCLCKLEAAQGSSGFSTVCGTPWSLAMGGGSPPGQEGSLEGLLHPLPKLERNITVTHNFPHSTPWSSCPSAGP